MKSTRAKHIIKSFAPLIFVLVSSTLIYGMVYNEYGLLEVFASETTLKTLLPGFFLLLPSISKIRCDATQLVFYLLVPTCVLIVFFALLRDTWLIMNTVLSLIYLCLGTYIGFSALADSICSECANKEASR